MADRTFTVRPSSDDDSSFEDIDRLSVNGHEASDGATKSAGASAAAALEEGMSEKLRDEITRLKKIISRLEDEHKEEEDKKQPLAIDQLTQFNALLMKENEDLQAKLRSRKVDEGSEGKESGVTDDHRARFKEYVDKIDYFDFELNNFSGITFVLTLLYTLCSFYAFHERTWFNVPAIILSFLLALFSLDSSIRSTRNVVVRLMILISDIAWLFSVEPKFSFILMVIKSILIVLSAWSMSDDMLTRYKEIKDRLTSACCPARFAGAEALRDGTPRIVEIEKTSYSLGFTISKNSDSLVYVAHILHDGAAEHCGLKAGDEIMKVNGMAVDGKTKEEVVSILEWAEGTVKLEVRNNKELVANEI